MPPDLDRRVAALRRSTIFAELDQPFLTRLAGAMTDVELPAGHVLIEPRTPGAGLYVIEDGAVTVTPRSGGQVELGAGEVVGEIALLARDGVRTARVQAKTPLRCLALDRASFQRALDEEPQLAVALLQVAAERLAAD
ncbi:MAG TPA: cyclic nucleotide-binding domain-containing protein [Gaiellaceae bacterium]|nr:cyclic nucleotide-binding domain-containing protein [Gaiellaceae bacterium]